MLGEYQVSATFNVTDLSPFDAGDDLRTNPFQEEGNDGGQDRRRTLDSLEAPIRPMTRAKAKRLKEALNGLITEVQAEVEVKTHAKNSRRTKDYQCT